jgi:hypothetical protein
MLQPAEDGTCAHTTLIVLGIYLAKAFPPGRLVKVVFIQKVGPNEKLSASGCERVHGALSVPHPLIPCGDEPPSQEGMQGVVDLGIRHPYCGGNSSPMGVLPSFQDTENFPHGDGERFHLGVNVASRDFEHAFSFVVRI